MEEKIKTIGLAGLIALVITLGINAGNILELVQSDAPQYFCESRPELKTVECDSFTKYVATYGKCVNEDSANYICKTGWLQVKDDTEISVPDEVETPSVKPISIKPTEGNKWLCNHDGCIAI